MKTSFKFLVVIACFFSVILSGCGSSVFLPNSKEATFLENIEGKDDKYLAWGLGYTNEEAEVDALKAAVYATIFVGGVGNSAPLLSTQEQIKHERFLNDFFADPNQWKRFVTNSNQGRIDADKRLKVTTVGRDKNGNNVNVQAIKLGVEVIVARKNLREYLEAKGIKGTMRFGG
jgi:hypothetical protein